MRRGDRSLEELRQQLPALTDAGVGHGCFVYPHSLDDRFVAWPLTGSLTPLGIRYTRYCSPASVRQRWSTGLKEENERLKARSNRRVWMKVSEKGAVSVYGLGRFPVTLYKEQWAKLLDLADDLRAFIKENDDKLKAKE